MRSWTATAPRQENERHPARSESNKMSEAGMVSGEINQEVRPPTVPLAFQTTANAPRRPVCNSATKQKVAGSGAAPTPLPTTQAGAGAEAALQLQMHVSCF